ncbi:hypothetical protein L8O18_06135 [Enterobacter asburiae]|nr:hypothetical protein [Enterobacter asburiae]
MSVKRYAAHTNIDDFKSDWHESKDGPMVRHEDYAALEARCAALAAENAGLKKYICDECYVENIKTGATKCAGLGMPETPATDAFLAEARASAFNDLCAEFVKHKILAGLDDSQKVTVFEATDALLHCAEQLAAQIRKGAQS